ncbi:hypothetical protein [Mesorhizobium sp.]|uniref:hypothetical protein n=1 Tax=Mesorhizobium sp. TaxID=1871066 RepID=UPI0025EC0910|nr:hypothetical protein [Mesorhizobium sp.]
MKDKVQPAETDEKRFNETLKRMLKTPPKPHKEQPDSPPKPKRKHSDISEEKTVKRS